MSCKWPCGSQTLLGPLRDYVCGRHDVDLVKPSGLVRQTAVDLTSCCAVGINVRLVTSGSSDVMENLQIRPAEAKDALQIAKVHVGTWQFAYRGQMPDFF